MFDDMHNNSRSQQVMIKTSTMEWFWWYWGGGGALSVFSQKTDVFSLLCLHCWTVKTVTQFLRQVNYFVHKVQCITI